MLNLPLLSVGAVGFVSVVGHLVTAELRALLDAYAAGDVAKATEIHQRLLPGLHRHVPRPGRHHRQGRPRACAACPAGPLRLPLVALGEPETEQLRRDLAAGGVHL